MYAGCQWGMLVVLAKLGNSVMVGQFALALAICSPVIIFTSLQLRAVQATDATGKYLFGHYLGLRLITTGLALLVIAGIVVLTGYPRETALVIMVVGLAKAFEAVSNVFHGLFQQHERMDRIAISMLIKGPLSLTALALGVYLSGQVLWGAVGLAVAWALILIIYEVPVGAWVLKASPLILREKLRPRWETPMVLRLIWVALPLGLVGMLISLNANIPRYFIEHYGGLRELGIFAAIAYLLAAGGMVINALNESATPRLARHYASGEVQAFRLLLIKLVGLGAAAGIIGIFLAWFWGREILTLIYSPEYAQHADLLLWLTGVGLLGYVSSFLGAGMTSARYFRAQLPLFASVTGATALACYWLIPAYGLRGAAATLLVAAITQALGSWAIVEYALRRLSKDR